MEIYIIRHTKPEVEEGICYGRLDVLPSLNFEKDSKEIINKLPDAFDILYSSPLKRCKLLSEKINCNLKKYDNRLMEYNFGEWEGKKFDEINQEELSNWMENFVEISPPMGENLIQMYQRVNEFLIELRKEKYNQIILITHSGVIRCIWTIILNIPLENIFKIPVGYNEILKINLGKTNKEDFIIQKK